MHILEKNLDNIYWFGLSINPSIFKLNTKDILKTLNK
jgi:hypothetical protein